MQITKPASSASAAARQPIQHSSPVSAAVHPATASARLRAAYGEDIAAWLEAEDPPHCSELRGHAPQEVATVASAAVGPHPDDTPAEAEFWKRFQNQQAEAQQSAPAPDAGPHDGVPAGTSRFGQNMRSEGCRQASVAGSTCVAAVFGRKREIQATDTVHVSCM